MSKEIYELTIQVDTNDGDYISNSTDITENDLTFIKSIVSKLHKDTNGNYRWEYGEYCRVENTPDNLYDISDEDIEQFQEFCPYGEHGFHTLVSIQYCPIPDYETLI